MDGDAKSIPKGWAFTRLGDVIPKARPKVPADPNSHLPFIGMDHIEAETFHLIGQDSFAKMKSAGSYFQPGDVLYGRLRPYLNKVHRAKFEGVASAEFIVLPSSEVHNSDFVKYLLHQRKFVDFAMSRSSGDRPRVKFDGISDFEFPLPPLNEQRRIVEKIETLFARLDKGEEALRDVQKLLARYRQSVLKAAVTGQLTADWRAENAHRLEHGRDLLARILQTRRETWDGRGKYKEPTGPDTTDLPELPKGWVWTSLGALISKGPQNGLYLPQSKYGTGTPILRIDDYQVDWLRPVQELRLVAAEAEDCDKYGLRHGDFVVNRVNSVSHLGKTILLPFEYEGAIFESNMMRFSVSDQISREYLNLYLTSDLGRKRLIKNCKHAVNQASINQGDVEATPVPLPPRLEQEEIAQRVAEESSREIAGLKTCQTELARSAALRQSILKDAFSGRLVPQGPADEPAAALLARINETRTAAPKKPRKTHVTS